MTLTSKFLAITTGIPLLLLSANALADDGDATRYEEQRATVLARYLESDAKNTSGDYAGYAVGGLSAAFAIGSVALIATSDQPTASGMEGAWVGTLGLGIVAVGAFASYAPDEDFYRPTLGITTDVGLGTSYVGLSLLMQNPSERAFAIGAAAYYARAGLRVVSLTRVRPISRGRLARHYRSIRTPKKREALTTTQLDSIEADFARRGGGLSPWLLHAPLMLGGAATLALMADDNATSSNRIVLGLQGGSLLVHGLVSALTETGGGYDAYESELESRGFQVALGPGPGLGLGVYGQW